MSNFDLVERTGPTCAARYAADLEIFLPRQGEKNFEVFPLEIEVSLGEQQFTEEDGFGFALKFRRVIIEVLVESCDISSKNRYQRSVDKEVFKHYLKRVKESSNMKRASGSGGLSLQLSQILSALGVEATLHAEAEAKLQNGDFETLEAQINFKIVRWAGAGRWHIGHELLGDPNELDGSLSGGYINQASDEQSDFVGHPLCVLEPNSSASYGATIELRARKTDCVYTPLGQQRSEARWARKNRAKVEQLVAVKMLEEQNRKDGFEPPEGELVLARGRVDILSDGAKNV